MVACAADESTLERQLSELPAEFSNFLEWEQSAAAAKQEATDPFFGDISAHADGERRGLVRVRGASSEWSRVRRAFRHLPIGAGPLAFAFGMLRGD